MFNFSWNNFVRKADGSIILIEIPLTNWKISREDFGAWKIKFETILILSPLWFRDITEMDYSCYTRFKNLIKFHFYLHDTDLLKMHSP